MADKKKKRPEYDDEIYAKALSRAADRVLRGEEFTYKAEQDPIYKQYEDTYTRLGKRAMEDTVGEVSARTGGLASSYAATAASQSYQGYMDKLADKVPELYKAAYDMYRDGQQQDMERLDLLRDMESERYDRWRDGVRDFETDRDYDREVYEDDRDYNRSVFEDERDYNRGVFEDERDYNRDVYEDERDYRLAVIKANQSGSSAKAGKEAAMDWSAVEEWTAKYGTNSTEDYIREHYKDLGYASVSAALAGWENYKRQRDYKPPQTPQSTPTKPQPTRAAPLAALQQAVAEGLTGEVLAPLVARLMEQGMDEAGIKAILKGKKG